METRSHKAMKCALIILNQTVAMKKDYQKPKLESFVISFSGKVLNVTSTKEVPGGGSGTPDLSRRSGWDDEE